MYGPWTNPFGRVPEPPLPLDEAALRARYPDQAEAWIALKARFSENIHAFPTAQHAAYLRYLVETGRVQIERVAACRIVDLPSAPHRSFVLKPLALT